MPKKNLEDNYVCLDNIPQKAGKLIWSESVGKTVSFKYNGLIGNLKINDYIIKTINNRKKYFLSIEYQGNEIGQVQTDSFVKGRIGKLIKPYINNWDYKIGQVVCDKKRNISIINRKLNQRTGVQLYQIKCNICGFDGFSFYSGRIGSYQNEYWTDKFRLDSGYGCPCCSGDIVVEGINDINTTAPWMSEFFVNKEDCKMHTYNSNKKIKMRCPYCNEERKYRVSLLYHYKYLPCVCRDNTSIPNKISYYLFRSLSKVFDYYENEYCPTWAKPYKYDNYIEFNQQKFIVELDGRLGHGNIDFSTGEVDTDGQKRDLIKNELAKNHNIKVFRINCAKNQNDYHSMFNDLLCVIREMMPCNTNIYINEEDIMKKSIGKYNI